MYNEKIEEVLNEVAEISDKVLEVTNKMTVEQAKYLREFLIDSGYDVDCCLDCMYNLIIIGVLYHTEMIA